MQSLVNVNPYKATRNVQRRALLHAIGERRPFVIIVQRLVGIIAVERMQAVAEDGELMVTVLLVNEIAAHVGTFTRNTNEGFFIEP